MTLYDASTVTYSSAAVTYDGGTPSPSPYPLPGIYIAFDDNPYTASPAWTEITQYVRGFSTHRGRSSDFDQFDTGTAQLVLDNRDRRFDPFYSSGPYFGKLLPRRQLRIIGQAGGTNYDVFRGYIAGWPVTWSEAGKDSTVTIQAFDALGLMANEIVPTDWVGIYIESLNVRRWWRATDARTSTTITDQPREGLTPLNLDAFTVGVSNLFETPPLADGILSNALFVRSSAAPAATSVPTVTGQSDLTITAFFNFTPIAGASAGFNSYDLGSMFVSLVYDVTAATFRLEVRNATSGRAYLFPLPTPNVPAFYAITVTANAGGTPSAALYVNDIQQTATSTTTTTASIFTRERMDIRAVIFQELAVFDRILSAAEMTTLYNYATGRLAETTTARMNRLVGTTDFASTLTAFTSAPVATVSEIGSGAGVIPEMQLVADSEGGELYVSKSGVLTTTARFDVFNATRSATPQATITDSGAGLEYGTELLIEYDADNLKNDITVQFSGNGEVNAYSDALIETYGGAATTIETQLADPTSANQLALLELGVEGALVPRISPIDLTPNTAASDWQTILGLELLDRVTFKRTPTVGNQFSRDALINAIDHQVVPGVWNTQVTLSMRYTSPLTLDDDVLGTLDFNYLG